MEYDSRPIGLIDSGVGGFTVLKALQQALPHEAIVYLGDSQRMPYGELANETIVRYADSDIRFLQQKGVKAILMACNTISSLKTQLTANVPLFSIIEAGCLATIEEKQKGTVGLIATNATVNNNAYPIMLATMTDQLRYVQHGTKALASIINNYPEEIVLLRKEIRLAIEPLIESDGIEDLLLGCTHYPIVRETIASMYPQLNLINPAIKQIEMLKVYLSAQNAFCDPDTTAHTAIYTTGTVADYTNFKSMIHYLQLHCDQLERCQLDIDY